jgi:hypothetical protein
MEPKGFLDLYVTAQGGRDAFVKTHKALDATVKARELAAQPRVAESVTVHKAVCDALARFGTDKPHPLLEAALLAAHDTHVRTALRCLSTARSLIPDDPTMRQILVKTDKAMRVMREVDPTIKHPRPCEIRHRVPRPGRAPRIRTNHRRRGSGRVSRAGPADPGEGDPDGDYLARSAAGIHAGVAP